MMILFIKVIIHTHFFQKSIKKHENFEGVSIRQSKFQSHDND